MAAWNSFVTSFALLVLLHGHSKLSGKSVCSAVQWETLESWWQQTYQVNCNCLRSSEHACITENNEFYLVSLLPPSVPKVPHWISLCHSTEKFQYFNPNPKSKGNMSTDVNFRLPEQSKLVELLGAGLVVHLVDNLVEVLVDNLVEVPVDSPVDKLVVGRQAGLQAVLGRLVPPAGQGMLTSSPSFHLWGGG